MTYCIRIMLFISVFLGLSMSAQAATVTVDEDASAVAENIARVAGGFNGINSVTFTRVGWDLSPDDGSELLEFGSSVELILSVAGGTVIHTETLKNELVLGGTGRQTRQIELAAPVNYAISTSTAFTAELRFVDEEFTIDQIELFFAINREDGSSSNSFADGDVVANELSAVPLPASSLLLLGSLAALGFGRRRKAVA